MYRILFLDAYDSFSNNIIALLRDNLPVSVVQIKIDDDRFVLNDDVFFAFLQDFDAVVAGPGPGNPSNVQDVGLIARLWSLPAHQMLPVLGICLGFQSLALSLGAEVVRLDAPRHGRVTSITHCDRDIFSEVGPCVVTHYHSLHVSIGMQGTDGQSAASFESTPQCSNLLPLAWDTTGCEPVLMALRHREKPFWGVQFHPESVRTNACGGQIVQTWFRKASEWSDRAGNAICHPLSSSASSVSGPPTPCHEPLGHELPKSVPRALEPVQTPLIWRAVPIDRKANPIDVLRSFRAAYGNEPLLLESGTRNGRPVNPETGRYTIIGLRDSRHFEVRYHDYDFTTSQNGAVTDRGTMSIQEAFDAMATIMGRHVVTNGPQATPFWGGLVGYISYEASLETISVPRVEDGLQAPEMWFVFVDRSVVIDHVEGVAYVQSIRGNDESWLLDAAKRLKDQAATPCPVTRSGPAIAISEPVEEEYCKKVEACQRHLRAGESYELCLTDETLIRNSKEPLSLYETLCETNPAPFAAYLRFESPDGVPSLDFVGSSPERFLSWTRPRQRTSTCQYRPIKGTVKKTRTMTPHKAEEILRSEKEQAENLMIVDLIRHDLNGVPRVGPVQVPKLMSVEEYETVYQLVSVIEGDVPAPHGGLAALARSLPPGSMTGAPKKRSCELLREIEGRTRGLYSGVIGYLDVGGGGDFSVVIRSAFRWSHDDVWRIGAGGAVTALSTAGAEWEEMLTKRERLLSVFL